MLDYNTTLLIITSLHNGDVSPKKCMLIIYGKHWNIDFI